MIESRQFFVPRLVAYPMLIPAGFVLLALSAISDRPREWIPGAPFLLAVLYALLICLVGRTRTRIHADGFELTPGPLPVGLRKESHAKSEIRVLFQRNRPQGLGQNRKQGQFFASVELNDGRWLNLLGPFPTAAEADIALRQIVVVWPGLPVSTPRFGAPPGGDIQALRLLLFWGGLFLGCLIWGSIATIWGFEA